ncbi:MAG: hypothetical protein J7497_09975 [Chitinophagaceae bacterium]|nr:hypothetical protein [Chitinophagaceae bacterium]
MTEESTRVLTLPNSTSLFQEEFNLIRAECLTSLARINKTILEMNMFLEETKEFMRTRGYEPIKR